MPTYFYEEEFSDEEYNTIPSEEDIDEPLLTKEQLDNREDLYINIPRKRVIQKIKPFVVNSPEKKAENIFFNLSYSVKKTIALEPEIESEPVPVINVFKKHDWGTDKVEDKADKVEEEKDIGKFPTLGSVEIERRASKTYMPRLQKSAVKVSSGEIATILGLNIDISSAEKDKPEKKNVICIHWKNGNPCPKGDECKFLHTGPQKPLLECYFGSKCNKQDCKFKHSEKVETPQEDIFKKTKICKNWKNMGSCPRGDECLFAHGVKELKTFKHKLCKNYRETGTCPRGSECLFAHGDSELVRPACRFGDNCFNKDKGCPFLHNANPQNIPGSQDSQESLEITAIPDRPKKTKYLAKTNILKTRETKKSETNVRNIFTVLENK